MDKHYHYPGKELELFQDATNWKKYFAGKIKPFLKGHVLEVGAGLGATARILNDGTCSSWTMLEPDEEMFRQLENSRAGQADNVILRKGTISNVQERYDTVLYIDVLEHIEKDRDELAAAAERLQAGGHLVVLSPAFHFLYSEFDRSIGHYKRYNKKTLVELTPSQTRLVSMEYLDALGFLASVANKWVLHQSYPTKKQVDFWDKKLLPLSKLLDPLFLYRFGKTILAIWQKESHANDR